MATNSSIEWTDATWNPIAGCSIVSPGCHNCYAMKMAHRLAGMGQAKYEGLTKGGHWTGKLTFDGKALVEPLKWKKPRRVFVNSMSDLFHENLANVLIDQVFAIMALCERHTFQVLTKRPVVMRDYINTFGRQGRINDAAVLNELDDNRNVCGPSWPLPNVWLGVSVEDQKRADERIPRLIESCAAVRFLSCEPLLSNLHVSDYLGHIDWVIVGGESGYGSRECYLEWIREIVQQCHDAEVPCFVKQLGSKPIGEWGPDPPTYHLMHSNGHTSRELSQYKNGRWRLSNKKGGAMYEFPADLRVREYPTQHSS